MSNLKEEKSGQELIRVANNQVEADLRARDIDEKIGDNNITAFIAEITFGAWALINNEAALNHALAILAGTAIAHIAHYGLSKLAWKYNNNRLYKKDGSLDKYNKARRNQA